MARKNVDDNERRPENSWELRNNSSNVSGVLNLELHSFSNNEIGSNNAPNKPRRPVIVSNHCSSPVPQSKRKTTPKYSCGECYCKKSPVQSRIYAKTPEEESEQPKTGMWKRPNRYRQCNRSKVLDDFLSPDSFDGNCLLLNKDTIRRVPHVVGCRSRCPKCTCLTRYYSTSQKSCKSKKRRAPSLQYATPRQVYEKCKTAAEIEQAYTAAFQEPEEETTKREDTDQASGSGRGRSNVDGKTKKGTIQSQSSSTSVSKLQKTISHDKCNCAENSNITFFKSTTDARKNLQKLNTFRKENYFDCYSAEVYKDPEDAEHKCVHKFALNDRLIPQPLNTDAFGMSRCVICNKPMQSETQVVKNGFDEETYSGNTSKNCKNFCGRKLPNQINITSKNERVEIKVPLNFDKFMDLFSSCSCIEIKNPVPANSIALRHQKGVV